MQSSRIDLHGARVLVTGGAARVGRALCLALAREGAHVAFTYRSSAEQARRTREELASLVPDARAYPCDLTRLEDVVALRERVSRWSDHLDLIVNAASPYHFEKLPFQDYRIWHEVTRASIDGCLYVCNEFLPLLRAAATPSIVNILDMTVRHPWTSMTAHAVGKSGMEALTRQMALELAPHIRVNGIVPGPVLPPDDITEKVYDKVAAKTLLKRWGTPEDVCQTLLFLARSGFMTGSIVFVDGGENIGMRSG